MKRKIIPGIVLFFLVVVHVMADVPQVNVTKDDYILLQGWRFLKEPQVVPPQGITFSKDTATWILQSGNIYPMEPTSDGTVTGLVFIGQGHFIMTIPNHFEVEQLRRFAEKPGIEKIDVTFTNMVLRTSSKILAPYAPDPKISTFEKNKTAAHRHEKWLEYSRLDADARIIAGLLTPSDDYLLVDVETPDFDWLTYQYDPFKQEEITLARLKSLNDFEEILVSLDRPEERDSHGRPTSTIKPLIDVTNATIQVDLKGVSSSVFDPIEPKTAKTQFTATITFNPQIDGAKALQFYLSPWAQVNWITRSFGTNIPFIRDATGKRFASMDNELYNGTLIVLLDQPTQKGVSQELVFNYDMKLYNYASGRDWYPGEANNLNDLHTGQLVFGLPSKYEVRAVGTPGQTMKMDGGQLVTWDVTTPTRMLGFSYGKGFKEEKIKAEGIPEIISFGTTSGALTTGNMVRNVAVDIARSIEFYQNFYGVKLPVDHIYATRIFGYHGQAFEGFLHLSHLTYDAENPGASELFRAHEAAHQFWGHLVGCKSYRDQWISEAFAEYSAMMYVQATLPKKGFFEEILEAYINEQTGSIKSMMSIFSRGWDVQLTAEKRKQIGPIAAGYRANTVRVPNAYFMQCYDKGALVLHMLRQQIRAGIRDRDVFRETLQDFLKTYAGKEASTEDFMHMLQKHTGIDWSSFFENWVYGTAVPTYHWSYTVDKTPDSQGQYLFTLTVRQTNVPSDFSTRVPVRFEFESGKTGDIWPLIDAPEKTIKQLLPLKLKKVIFNPDFSVLAVVNKD